APRSRPACCAMRRANGLAKTRPLPRSLPGSESAAGPGCTLSCEGGTTGAGRGTDSANFSRAETSSPSPSNTAIGAFTLIPWAPSGTRILPIFPSSTASTSIVALFLEPFGEIAFGHRRRQSRHQDFDRHVLITKVAVFARKPQACEAISNGELGARDCFASLAMTFSWGLAVGDLARCRDNVLDLWQRETLEVRGIR